MGRRPQRMSGGCRAYELKNVKVSVDAPAVTLAQPDRLKPAAQPMTPSKSPSSRTSVSAWPPAVKSLVPV